MSKWHRRDASIFAVLLRDTLLTDSEGNIDNSREGDCEGDGYSGSVSVFLAGNSRGVGWLNGRVDCRRFAVDERAGCDLVINSLSSEIL